MKKTALGRRLARLAIGLALTAGFFCVLAFGPMWPGVAGRMIERNMDQQIQATALFYQDLEAMSNLEDRLVRFRAETPK